MEPWKQKARPGARDKSEDWMWSDIVHVESDTVPTHLGKGIRAFESIKTISNKTYPNYFHPPLQRF